VWTQGANTELEAWVAAKSRKVIVTREAIEDYLRLDRAAAEAMTAQDRRNFVRDNLPLVIAAANRKTDAAAPVTQAVTIGAGEL
jgi:hypothetical protein